MGRLSRFLAWPLAEKWLLFEAWLVVWTVRVSLWICRYTRTRAWLDRFNREPAKRPARKRPPAARIATLVEIASRFVPGGGHCLTRALAAQLLLSRRGYPVDVTIGVAKDENDKLIAHAWVKCDGAVLIGGDSDLHRYTELERKD